MSEKLTALETAELDLADARYRHIEVEVSLEAVDTLMPPVKGGYATDQQLTVAEAAEILHEDGRIDPEQRDMKIVRMNLVNKETAAAANVGEARAELNRIKAENFDRAVAQINKSIGDVKVGSPMFDALQLVLEELMGK